MGCSIVDVKQRVEVLWLCSHDLSRIETVRNSSVRSTLDDHLSMYDSLTDDTCLR